MAKATDISIEYKGKKHYVPEGFTVEEYRQSMISVFPEVATATLFKNKEGEYVLKGDFKQKA